MKLSGETESTIKHSLPLMEGWLTVARGMEMAELVVTIEPETVVEIGVFGGRSLLAQALALRDVGRGVIYGIDPWKKQTAVEGQTDDESKKWWQNLDLEAIHHKAMQSIWKWNLDKHVVILRSASEHCVQCIPPIDILYIDGCHSEETSCQDVRLYLPKVKQNGYIWFDDSDWLSTQKAMMMLDASCVKTRDAGNYRLYVKR